MVQGGERNVENTCTEKLMLGLNTIPTVDMINGKHIFSLLAGLFLFVFDIAFLPHKEKISYSNHMKNFFIQFFYCCCCCCACILSCTYFVDEANGRSFLYRLDKQRPEVVCDFPSAFTPAILKEKLHLNELWTVANDSFYFLLSRSRIIGVCLSVNDCSMRLN